MTTPTGAPRRRVCPGCESAMQVFFTRDVEIDRCMFCGGIWLDAGELERAVGRPVVLAPSQVPTDRRCAECRQLMHGAQAEGLSLERCSVCRSIYLDDQELQALGGEQRLRPQPKEGPAAQGTTFKCLGCGDVRPGYEGRQTRRGWSCSHCYGAMNDAGAAITVPRAGIRIIAHRGKVRTLFGTYYRDARYYDSLGDLADDIFLRLTGRGGG